MELTLAEVLKLVRKWWWVFVLCPLLAASAAYLVSGSMTPMYQTGAIILVEQSQVPGMTTHTDIMAAERRAQTYSTMMTTRPVLDETIRRLDLPLTSGHLNANISVSSIRDTQLLSLTVTDSIPERAATIANTLGQVFIDQTLELQAAATGSSRQELEQSLERVRSQIDETTAQISALEARPDVADPAVQAELRSLQSILTQHQTTYTGLLETQQRMELAAAQNVVQIRFVEQAGVPITPVSPRTSLNTTIAGILGLMVAAGLVMVVGYLNNTVETSEDIERLTGRAALGMIPVLQSSRGIEALIHPRSPATEGYRSLRTNLQFAMAGQPLQTLMVTSVRPDEGKTTTISNLATVLAQAGQHVILVDADLRSPGIHRLFTGLHNRMGLTNLLMGENELESKLQDTEVPGLRMLPSGPLPPNPADILNLPRFQALLQALTEMADFVLVDAPPMAVTDPLIIAGRTDGILVVTNSGQVHSNEFVRTLQELSRAGTPILGVVLNRVARTQDNVAYYQAAELNTGTPFFERTKWTRRLGWVSSKYGARGTANMGDRKG